MTGRRHQGATVFTYSRNSYVKVAKLAALTAISLALKWFTSPQRFQLRDPSLVGTLVVNANNEAVADDIRHFRIPRLSWQRFAGACGGCRRNTAGSNWRESN